MPSTVQIKTRALSREKLAAIFRSHEMIVAFENMATDVSVTLPVAADNNAAAAEAAQDTADAAQIIATAAQVAAGQALSMLADVLVDELVSAMAGEIAALRARVAALEQGTTA